MEIQRRRVPCPLQSAAGLCRRWESSVSDPDSSRWDEWEILALAYLGAASTHYKNTWSPLDFDILEFSVGDTYQTAYDKAHEVASDKEWQALVRLFDSFDAHQRKRWRKRAT